MEDLPITRRKPMTDGEYRICQDLLLNLARIALLMPDLELFLQRIGTAQAVGPIVDPTLYRQASGNLEGIQELATRALPLQRSARRQAGRLG